MNDLVRLLTLQDANTRIPMLGTALLGLACGVVGVFAVLRRRALVGDAVAHAALPGVALAFLIVGGRSFPILLGGAGLAGLLAAATISFVRARTRIRDDAITAIVIAGFFGVGTVLSRIAQDRGGGNATGLDAFIFGKAATMVRADVITIAIATSAIIATVALLYKELKLLCFDREFAGAQGWPVRGLDLALMGLISLAVVAALPAVGVILAVALLVIPPSAARFWSDRLSVVVVLSGAIGVGAGILGTAFSATVPAPAGSNMRGWPTGPIITLFATLLFIVSMAAAPRRGLLPALARRIAFRRRIAVEHLMRAAFEVTEAGGDPRRPLAEEELRDARAWSRGEVAAAIRRARRQGLIEGHRLCLTESGEDEARKAAHRHRLWETYLVERAGIAPDHVDRDADFVEHILPAALLRKIEARVRPGRAPTTLSSPHPVAKPDDEGRRA